MYYITKFYYNTIFILSLISRDVEITNFTVFRAHNRDNHFFPPSRLHLLKPSNCESLTLPRLIAHLSKSQITVQGYSK